jgi:hypothetical protein
MRRNGPERGAALVYAVLVTIVFLGTTGALLALALSSSKLTSTQLRRSVARGLAESGIANTYLQAWTAYLAASGGQPGSTASYRAYLSDVLKLSNGASIMTTTATAQSGATVATTLARRDVGDRDVYLTVSSTAEAPGGDGARITAVWRVGGKPFRPDGFGLLTNQVNCTLCHARFDNVARYYNRDPSKRGTFDRVKLASLENLMIRTGSADSVVAGTLYTRGSLLDNKGSVLSDLTGTSFDAYKIDRTDGHIIESPTGALTVVDLTNTTGSPPPAFGQFYKDYALDPAQQVDGSLPSVFPPAIPDPNGNKIVDASEFDAARSGATGTLSGGVIYEVNGTYTDTSLPSRGTVASISGTSQGPVMLIGTAADPVVLSGDVAIDGDVVISGYVKGSGEILARGNLYIMGDVIYADGTDASGNRTFGVAADGTRNTIAFAAGGSVLAGDFLSTATGALYSTGSKLFTASEIGIFNRSQWQRTQRTLPDSRGVQVPNSTYDPSFVPRYYTIKAGDPIYTWTPAGKVYWNDALRSWIGPEHGNSLSDMTVVTPPANAAILSFTPSWASQATLQALYKSVDAKRPTGRPMEIDGLVYTNNAIMSLARKENTSAGQILVNGALVAADTGILAPGDGGVGLQLNYDAATARFLHVTDPTTVDIRTVLYGER